MLNWTLPFKGTHAVDGNAIRKRRAKRNFEGIWSRVNLKGLLLT